MKKFHALYIGVDAYASVTSLNGCVNDALSIYEYMAKNIDKNKFDFEPTFLLSIHDAKKAETQTRFEKDAKKLDSVQLPTRQNILDTLKSYIQKVQAGDVFFFFYAGHGSTERAHPYFGESTGKLQTLVPSDARTIDPNDNSKRIRDVLDKEVRYLIRKLWEGADENVEIIIVQDSCHSSEASRDLIDKKEENLNIQEENFNTEPKIRQAEFDNEFNGQYRALEDLDIFDDEIKADIKLALELEEKARTNNNTSNRSSPFLNTTSENSSRETTSGENGPVPFDLKSPEAPHIHMSACGKLQFAYETNYAPNKKGGVFTHTLIRFLEQTGGQISYHDLFNRAKASIDGVFNQTPSIYIKGDNSKRYERFLGGSLDKKEGEFNVTFQTIDGQTTWSVDAGALLGLPVLRENEAIPVQLYDLNLPNDTIEAQITYIKAEASTLTFTNKVPDTAKIYKARIPINFFIAAPLKIMINPIASYNNPLTENLGDVFQNAGVRIVDNESVASHRIIAKEGCYELYESGQASPTIRSTAIKLNSSLAKILFPNLGEDLLAVKVGQSMPIVIDATGNYLIWKSDGTTLPISKADFLELQAPYVIEALTYIAEKLKGQEAQVFVIKQVTYNNPFKSYFALPEAEYYWSFIEETSETATLADYILEVDNGQYILKSPTGENPVIAPSANLNKIAAFQTMAHLREMNRWQEAKALANPHPDSANLISAHLFELEINGSEYAIGNLKEYPYYFWTKIVARDDAGKILKHEPLKTDQPLTINFKTEGKYILAPLDMVLRQRTKQGTNDKNLYVGVLSLGYDYEIASLIDAGAQDWIPFVSDGLVVEGEVALNKSFSVPALAKAGKATNFSIFLKILVAYKRFDPSEWLQEGLPQAEDKSKSEKESGANRAVLSLKKGERAGDWIAFTFPINLSVPEGLNLNDKKPNTHTVIRGRGGSGGPFK